MLALESWERNPWSIFDELEALQENMDLALSGGPLAAEARRGNPWRRPTRPPMNIWSSANDIVIDAELPGVDPKDVDISVEGDELTVSQKENEKEAGGERHYTRQERPAGGFSRTLKLPFRPEAASVKANYKNGILRLTVPRSEAEKPKKITVEAA